MLKIWGTEDAEIKIVQVWRFIIDDKIFSKSLADQVSANNDLTDSRYW